MNIYRSTIVFLDNQFKNTPPSNMFIRAESLEQANSAAESIFKKSLIENGLTANFDCKTVLSSIEEAEQYRLSMSNKIISRMVN